MDLIFSAVIKSGIEAVVVAAVEMFAYLPERLSEALEVHDFTLP